ncbi:MAG: hypothetical protein ABIH21_05095 [Patescibacteria group bacterium]
MSKTPNYDNKIMKILDSTKPGERVCELTGEKWQMTDEEIEVFRQLGVPPPNISPKTMVKWLAGFGTGVAIWKNKDVRTGKDIYSYIHPDHFIKVMDDKEWMNEEFLMNDELNIQAPFFPQLESHLRQIPLGALLDEGSSPNSFGVELIKSENCYMTFFAYKCRKMLNTINGVMSEDCYDVTNTYDSKESALSNLSYRLFRCRYVNACHDCMSSSFLFDCRNCEYCFGATNKRNKSYLFFNQQCSKEEWEKKVGEIDLGCRDVFEEYEKKFIQLMEQEAVWPENFSVHAPGSIGDYLVDCVNCKHGFSENDSRNCFWDFMGDRNEGNYAVTWSDDTHQSFNCNGILHSQKMICSHFSWYNNALEYCFFCFNCEYCFGCIGLKRKQYCIFNKQYSEDEYWLRVDEIKCAMLKRKEYGQFFPAKFSPISFPYSVGDFYIEYTKDELDKFEVSHFDAMVGSIVQQSHDMLTPEQLPICVQDPKADDIVGKPVFDKTLKRLFTITKQELDFLRKIKLPLPKEHVFVRLQKSIRWSNSWFSVETNCGKCEAKINVHENKTFLNRKVYCCECYLQYLEQKG